MMTYVALGLLIIGLLLVGAECFIPGFGVCGISGILALIAAMVVTAVFMPFGVYIMLAEIAVVGAVLYLVVRYLREKQLDGKLILNETLREDKKDIGDLDYFMGKEGTTKTPLRPFGSADFNGMTVEVCSDGSYISERKKVKVINISGQKIIVKQLDLN